MMAPPIDPLQDLADDDDEIHPEELYDPEAYDEEFDEWEREESHRVGKDGRTDSCKSVLETLSLAEVAGRLEQAFELLRGIDLDVTNLLYYITRLQGTNADTKKIQYARTALLQSDELPLLVRKWRHGRARSHNKGISTRGARESLDEWSIENVNMLINQEMRALGPHMTAPIGGLSEESLLSVNLDDLETTMMEKSPTLWTVLHNASSTPQQLETLTYKTHSAPIIMIIAMCCFGRSQHRCLLQQLNSIYFSAGGLAARAYDTTHMYGITMSHSWSYHLIDKLAADARKKRNAKIRSREYPFRVTHDNLNLAFKVFEQRTDKQTSFDSGTAATVYFIHDPEVIWPDREACQVQREIGSRETITLREIMALEAQAMPLLRERAIQRVLKFLTDAPEFSFDTYEFKDSDIFFPLPPREQLPTGPAHSVEQFVMDTVAIESASQQGTKKCLDEWMRQFGLDTPEEVLKDDPIFKTPCVLMGDQLTTLRIRTIKTDLSEDFNFLQRGQYFNPQPGWFHTQLAFEMSIHKQYYTTYKPFGLSHGFDILGRKGLHSTSVKGTFHHGMQEALLHMAIAHFRDLWVVVGKVSSIKKLRKMRPERLRAIATIIVDDYASQEALRKRRKVPVDEEDKAFVHGIMFCRDILNYIELDEAMRTGDVGRIQDLLPRLLFRFNGGGNSHYAIEILELLQGIHKEWTPELRTFILRYCWLARTEGSKDGFLAFDMMQEHNIRDIKQLFAAHGPYSSWDYIKRISASIPTQRKVKEHVEAHFNHFRRGKSHTTPKWEDDVVNLQKAYNSGDAHVHKLSRTTKVTTSVPDFINVGSSPERLGGLISRWSARRSGVISTAEEFGEDVSSTSDITSQISDDIETIPTLEEELVAMLDGLQIDPDISALV